MLRVYNNTARYVDQGGNKVWDKIILDQLYCRVFSLQLQ